MAMAASYLPCLPDQDFLLPPTRRCWTAMQARLSTDEALQACRKRKWIPGLPNGRIENVLGFRQFSLWGLQRVHAE